MKKHVNLPVLGVLCTVLLLSACSGKKRSHVFESFTVEFDNRDWVTAYSSKQGKDSITQYLPDGSTIMTWTEMITERSFGGLQETSDPKSENDAARTLAEKHCEKVDWQVADQAIGSLTYVAHISGCEEARPQHEVGRFIISSRAIYLVQYQSKKATLGEAEKRAWIEVLARAHYSDIID